ncbi:tellurite resistance TerB family protein [Lyngbya confervoides]|uniref:TerB family tellurite resistance protein n=1 Tax=Lyngbya confervoides BDU141951 TaxID=1574623 RepID=A0ABD4SZ05_9CYAN|nr:TerB family tellurite resistance protein [Lyngbya confervoides]MCM1981529.1 TerB family tellurite resistance protein [Lyngbya confervoides BDU141951]
MSTEQSKILLMKIIVGVAWVDGKIQPEEKEYIRRLATEQGLSDQPEIKSLINELRTVTPQECDRWIQEFMGQHPSVDARNQLIEDISGLIYSDGEMDSAEAKLLTHLQDMPEQDNQLQTFKDRVIHRVQDIYQQLKLL